MKNRLTTTTIEMPHCGPVQPQSHHFRPHRLTYIIRRRKSTPEIKLENEPPKVTFFGIFIDRHIKFCYRQEFDYFILLNTWWFFSVNHGSLQGTIYWKIIQWDGFGLVGTLVQSRNASIFHELNLIKDFNTWSFVARLFCGRFSRIFLVGVNCEAHCRGWLSLIRL